MGKTHFLKIEDYLLGKLPDAEKRDFETSLKNDTDLREALENAKLGSAALEHLRLHQKVKTILGNDRVEPPTPKFWAAPLAVALVLGWLAWFLFFQKKENPPAEKIENPTQPVENQKNETEKPVQPQPKTDPKNLPKTQNPKLKTAPPPPVALLEKFADPMPNAQIRGSENLKTEQEKALDFFEKRDFRAALQVLETLPSADFEVMRLRAHCFFYLKNYEAAYPIFDDLEKSGSQREASRWMKMLCRAADFSKNKTEVDSLLSTFLAKPESRFYQKAVDFQQELR